jgi:hypothetical protein
MARHAAYTIDRKRITWDEIDGETLIINAETGYYFSLDGVGSLIWSMLADGVDERDMVARIVNEYEVEESTARDDLQALVDVLAGEELVDGRGHEETGEVR